MTVTKSRGATKKLGPISVGSKIIRFKIPNVDRRFTVHEDLICRTSRFFKDRLQKHRKPILSIDECYVCAEALNAMVKDISFCADCGQNVHEVCIEAWKRSSTTRLSKESTPTCPMCRARWKNDSLLNHLDMKSELDAEAVQTYLDWLYSSILDISPKIRRYTDIFNLTILKLWAVANAVDDPTFKAKVIVTYFAEAHTRFWIESVNWAFVERKCDDEIRNFIIDMSLARIEPGWFKNESKAWPAAFVSALADGALVHWKDRRDFEALRKMWMKKLDVETDVVAEEEVTAPSSGKKVSAFAVPDIRHYNYRAADPDRAISGARDVHQARSIRVTRSK